MSILQLLGTLPRPLLVIAIQVSQQIQLGSVRPMTIATLHQPALDIPHPHPTLNFSQS